jgi:hypothetical protein
MKSGKESGNEKKDMEKITQINKERNISGEKLPHKSSNKAVWKIIAIVFIVIFVIVIAGGLFRLFHFKNSLKPASQQEISAATDIVLNELANKGANIKDYELKVSDMIRVIERNNTPKRIIEVSVRNSTTRHMFLIDADTWQILMHSESEFYGWMDNDFGGPGGGPGGMGPRPEDRNHEEKRKLAGPEGIISPVSPLNHAVELFSRF